MDELTKRLPGMVREETLPQIPGKIRWKAKFFGKTQILEYMRTYYEEESEGRIPFYLPCIYMKEIFRYLCRYGRIPRKAVSMVLIDAGDSRTDYFLYEFLEELNDVTIVTDRREYFEGLQERAFQELGLLVDLVLPWERKNISGNLVWDFSENLQMADCYPKGSICFVGHKKEWKIRELLRECQDITAVSIGEIRVGNLSLYPPLAEAFLVPPKFPFRKGRCEELKKWCHKNHWMVKPYVSEWKKNSTKSEPEREFQYR